ncbi:MAG TPA: hypothetical protein VEJ16_16865 [Alphaproteobacteria bacterium]|nr:hypothetical protein [Alphaproteobacteria bacterium]
MGGYPLQADTRDGRPAPQPITAMSPEQRAEAVVRSIYERSASEESRVRAALAVAISSAIIEERRNCARLLDAIKDEYIDWCSVNRVSTSDQMQVANMLSRAAASVRDEARRLALRDRDKAITD